MLSTIIQYIRDWFPPDDSPLFGKKRKGSDLAGPTSPKRSRQILSSVTSLDDPVFYPSPRSSILRPLNSRTIHLDDVKMPKTKDQDDDLIFMGRSKTSTEKKADAKKLGLEFVSPFSSFENGVQSKKRRSNTKSLDYSIRLDDKQKYQKLLANVSSHNSPESSFETIYGTPCSSFNRSKRLVELASPKFGVTEFVDLTNDDRRKVTTKDRVIKILDDFANTPPITVDSDSDVEVLPRAPSPKPDIKVEPINSLKTFMNTFQSTDQKWLEKVSQRHNDEVERFNREIETFEHQAAELGKLNHEIRIKDLERKVKTALSIKDTILPVDDVEEEVELPELTRAHLKLIKRAFSGDPNEVLSPKFSLYLSRRDIQTLSGLNWLNDNVINFYMNLIIDRAKDSKWPAAYCMNTFFYPKLVKEGPEALKRWTRRVDLFSHEFICVPIHLTMHWCMAIINLQEKSIKYYDSMGNSNDRCLRVLAEYLEFEHMDKKKQAFSTDDFVLENVKNIPQQMNGSDCGVFSCTFAEFATRKAKFTFTQEHMAYLRQKTVVEIMEGELLIK